MRTKKYLYILGMLAVFSLIVFSCAADDVQTSAKDFEPGDSAAYSIGFRNGPVSPPANVDDSLLQRLSPSYAGGNVHVVVQFQEIPSLDEQRNLKEMGLELQDYIGSNAWFASVKRSANPLSEMKPTLRWAGEILPEHRLSPKAFIRDFDEYATNAEGEVGLSVLFFEDVPDSKARDILGQNDATIYSHASTIREYTVIMPISLLDDLEQEDAVKYVEQTLPPLTPTNDQVREVLDAETLWASPYYLDGTGVHVFVYDGGVVDVNHPDFGGRVTDGESGGYVNNHPTHVAGTIGGSGLNSGGSYAGVAPSVTMLSMEVEFAGGGEIFINDDGDIESDYNYAINTVGVHLANNSIGSNIARNWYDCSYEGDYVSSSALLDSILTGSLGQTITINWSNGNERGNGRCGTQYNTTPPPITAKNPIAVGALNSNDDSMTDFSSWGPTDDGRLRPDVSAPGCQSGGDGGITSTFVGTGYGVMCGTSMSGPATCGVLALMMEAVRENVETDPINSTFKAALINTAVDLGNVGPDYMYGYGRVDGQAAVDLMAEERFLEDDVSNGQSVSHSIVVTGGSVLNISLAWDDPPGTPNTNPNLVNNLDMTVTNSSGTVYRPWLLNPASPSSPATTGTDTLNNTEKVTINSPQVGVYTVTITGASVPSGPQEFSLACSHDFAPPSNGSVSFDSEWFDLNSSAGIVVSDWDLAGEGTLEVDVRSDSHTPFFAVTLSEVGSDSGVFTGSVALGSTLPVAHGDQITVLYVDEDDGMGGSNVNKYAYAYVDGLPPEFDGLSSATGSMDHIDLVWNVAVDDTSVTYSIYRATTPGGYNFNNPYATTSALTYEDSSVTTGQWYYYVVRASDALGHQETNTLQRAGRSSALEIIWEEDFETDSIAEWTIINGLGGDTWTTDNPGGRSSSYWTGTFFIADSDHAGSGTYMDEQLISPVVSTLGYFSVHLQYGHSYDDWPYNSEKGDADIRIEGGSWHNVARYEGSDTEGTELIDISALADETSEVEVRFHYYDSSYDYYWGVDNIKLLGIPVGSLCPDTDGDGYGFPASANCPFSGTDCNDSDPDINPGMTEVCNGINDNCVGGIDEGGNALCDNGLFCDGEELCSGYSGCTNGTPPACGDDGLFCSGDEYCDEEADECGHTGNPCEATETCDETNDECDPAGDDDDDTGDDDTGDDDDNDTGDDDDDDTGGDDDDDDDDDDDTGGDDDDDDDDDNNGGDDDDCGY